MFCVIEGMSSSCLKDCLIWGEMVTFGEENWTFGRTLKRGSMWSFGQLLISVAFPGPEGQKPAPGRGQTNSRRPATGTRTRNSGAKTDEGAGQGATEPGVQIPKELGEGGSQMGSIY